MLLDLVTHRLVEAKVLLSGVSTVERLISEVRERVAPGAEGCVGGAGHYCRGAADLGAGPAAQEPNRYVSGTGVGKALERHVELRGLGAAAWDLSTVPAGKDREQACGARVTGPRPAGKSCDEYPFASTREGGTTLSAIYRGWAWVPKAEQASQGGLIIGFYKQYRVIDRDPFYVQV